MISGLLIVLLDMRGLFIIELKSSHKDEDFFRYAEGNINMDRKRLKTELLIHDLKNPLAVIEAGIDSLISGKGKYGDLTEKQLKVLHRVLRNTKIAKGLVNDILEVGRSNKGVVFRDKCFYYDFVRRALVDIFDLTDQDAAEKIRGCTDALELKTLLSEKGIFINMDEELLRRELYLDSRKIGQVLRNLISNALKYRKDRVEIDIREDEDSFLISVLDDGEGIKEVYHDKIFESYFQLEDERQHCVRGHGLGLAGALILVEDMAGEMYLESDEGKGAKFSVRIPLAEQ
jgi:signal transduction histidine kinase